MGLVKGIKGRRPEIGKIKIGLKGEERKSNNNKTFRPPEKLSHFVVTGLERDARGDFKVDAQLMAEIAPKGCPKSTHPSLKDVPALTEIPIELLSDDIGDVISQAYCYYPGKAIAGRCDGETCTWFVDNKGNRLKEPFERPCNGEHETKGWKLHTRFDVAIRSGRARFGGLYTFRTTSEITAEQLVGSLATLKELARGTLQGIPLVMVVRPMQVAPDGKPTTVYVVHVEARAESQQKLLQAVAETEEINAKFARRLEAARAEARKLLAAPGTESPEEQEEIAEEFHPEVVDAPVVEIAGAPAATAQTESAAAAAKPAATAPAPSSSPTTRARRQPPPPPARRAAKPEPAPAETPAPTTEPAPAASAPQDEPPAPTDDDAPPPADESEPPHDAETGEVAGDDERVLAGVKLSADGAFLARAVDDATTQQHFDELHGQWTTFKEVATSEREYLAVLEHYFLRRQAVLKKPMPPEFAAKLETRRKKGAA